MQVFGEVQVIEGCPSGCVCVYSQWELRLLFLAWGNDALQLCLQGRGDCNKLDANQIKSHTLHASYYVMHENKLVILNKGRDKISRGLLESEPAQSSLDSSIGIWSCISLAVYT